jgi:hypothetical protein
VIEYQGPVRELTSYKMSFRSECGNRADDDGDGLVDDDDPECQRGDLEAPAMSVFPGGHACAGTARDGYWTNLSAKIMTCRVARSIMRRFDRELGPWVALDLPGASLPGGVDHQVGNWACSVNLNKSAFTPSGYLGAKAVRVTCAGSWGSRLRFYGVV